MYKINFFNFQERKDNYLITNDFGKFLFIDKKNFDALVNKEELDEDVKKELLEKNFIYEESEELFSIKKCLELRQFKGYLLMPTILHIFVVSKNCNFNCIYCQAGHLSQGKNYCMDKATAKAAVDIALQSPSKYLTFEFQGGEPLTNYEIIKYIVEYSKEVAQNKIIEYNIVSNLTLLTDEMIEFFMNNGISVCTSIDGDEKLHNLNRPYVNGNSYETTVEKIRKLQKLGGQVGAIETTTKFSLNKYKEIVDEYINLGMDSIFIRPLTKLGKAKDNWGKIGYTAEEFLDFFKNALNYIICLNKKGIFISEGHSLIFLKKILTNKTVNYMELRSPCGGAIGQLAYYYDGNIYTCDEGRMLSEMGNDSFLLGNVFESNYSELMESDCTKAMCIASCLECIPFCHSCVYHPYCGTCPVINLAQDKNIFMKNSKEYRCKIYSGILEILFDYIENDKETLDVFYRWVNQ